MLPPPESIPVSATKARLVSVASDIAVIMITLQAPSSRTSNLAPAAAAAAPAAAVTPAPAAAAGTASAPAATAYQAVLRALVNDCRPGIEAAAEGALGDPTLSAEARRDIRRLLAALNDFLGLE